MSPSEEEWGVGSLVHCVLECSSVSCMDLIERAMAGADGFAAGAKQHDDMTLVAARFLCE